MTNQEFVDKCISIKERYATKYAKGTFGQCATASFINGKAKQYPEWYNPKGKPSRVPALLALPDDTRLFDCVGLIKGVIWGFPNTVYTSNGLRDMNDQTIWEKATEKSYDFTNIQIGELLWMQGHVGVYIGNGRAIECASAWEGKVMITAVENIGKQDGLNGRKWIGHAKIPTIIYNATEGSNLKEKPKDYKIIAEEIIKGKWGNGDARKAKLKAAGYTDEEIKKIQSLVNDMLKKPAPSFEIWHTVIGGETASGIAKKYGVSLDSIKKLNPDVKNWDLIYPKQKIRIK